MIIKFITLLAWFIGVPSAFFLFVGLVTNIVEKFQDKSYENKKMLIRLYVLTSICLAWLLSV